MTKTPSRPSRPAGSASAPPSLPASVQDDPQVPATEKQGIQSADAAMRILQVMAETPRAMPLTEIAQLAGMSPSTAHRYMTSLLRSNMVSQETTSSRYNLGPFALRLGLAALSRLTPYEVCGDVLATLRDDIDMPVFLSILGEHGPTAIRWLDAANFLSISIRLGSSAPLLTASSGRIFLAYAAPMKIDRFLRQELAQREARGETDYVTEAEVRRVQDEVRQRRMAAVNGERIPGVHGISVPVFDASGELVASLSVVGLAHAFDARDEAAIAGRLRQAGRDASSRLGFAQLDFYDDPLAGSVAAA